MPVSQGCHTQALDVDGEWRSREMILAFSLLAGHSHQEMIPCMAIIIMLVRIQLRVTYVTLVVI